MRIVGVLVPHEVVRDAARIARKLADQARRAGEPGHATYFERMAARAEHRAARLHRIEDVMWKNRIGRGDCQPKAEFDTWHVYDAGGPVLRLKIRYREDGELPDWRNSPDLFEALEQATAAGWHAYDREPGDAPGEYVIIHLKREA